MTTVAIHQPNYIPWVGFFDKMRRADLFVILDHAAFSKGRDCWHARNRVRTPDGWRYLTIPMPRGSEAKPFNEICFADKKFKKQHPRLIQPLYSKSRFYKTRFSGLCEAMANRSESLADYNLEIIKWMAGQFGIRTEMVRSSGLDFDRSKTKTAMVIGILRACGADRYLSGDGAKGYLDPELFKSSGIGLEFQDFKARQYRQAFDGWVPNLSAIDLLFNAEGLDDGVEQKSND